MKRPHFFPLAIASLLAGLAGCGTAPGVAVFDTGSQVELRSYQSRLLPGTDREQFLRVVISTMQDLGFVIDKADALLGTVTGTKLAGYEVRMTVALQAQGRGQFMVRANAQSKSKPTAAAVAIEEPGPYQDFFAALEKALFLAAH
ncbi:MAG TPA: hypothetical protein VL200_12140 [Lacunisphaera sp.]|jgi:hypothetical protein|nr:hypothetical protein [Lacunisphaera sp.]